MKSILQIRTIGACAIFAIILYTGHSVGHVLNVSDVYDVVEVDKSVDSVKIFSLRQSENNVTFNETCPDENSLNGFPPDLFTEEQLLQGAVVLHVVAAIYLFTFLACICNYYFLPAVECVCEDFNIPKDLAAAVIMATTSAVPDFFTNAVSTLITDSDMGLGNVIGSLMFNTLGVAAIASLSVEKPIQLDWWPVCRDCVIYGFHTCILMIVAWGGVITFEESCIMIFFCLMYYLNIVLMNYKLKNRLRTFIEDHLNCCASTRYDFTLPGVDSAKGKLPYHKKHKDRRQSGIYAITPTEFSPSPLEFESKNFYIRRNDEEEEMSSPFKLPKGGKLNIIWWVYTWPIRFSLACLCPNPITMRRLYPLTFLVCIGLLGVNSYLVVWMLSVFGNTLGIPDVIMGLTILAAGGATPEAFSSAVSVRRGESGIGISNALGANSLSILLSLGVPWFIKNAININTQQEVIYISSDGIEYIIGILMLAIVTLFVVLALFGFRLRRTVGVVLMIAYLVLVALQVLTELNVFFPSEDGC